MIETTLGIAGAAVLLLGLVLTSIGLYGMLRKPTMFEQLHAAGLVTGPGVILVLLASIASASAEIVTSALLVVVFVLVTSSMSTHAIALAAWRVREASRSGTHRVEPGSQEAAADAAGTRRTSMRVLLAHDGSPGADVATALAASLPWPAGSVIRVIRAMDGDLEPFPQPRGTQVATADPATDLAHALEAVARSLDRPGVVVDHVLPRGEPATAIADEAGRFGADLVVIGSRGLGPLRSLLVGSVAAATVDAAPCSVLVARNPGIREAVLGADGSAEGDTAIDAVARWPIFEGVAISVLSVVTDVPTRGRPTSESGANATGARAQHQRLADEAAERLIAAGRRASAHVRTGDVGAQMVGFAAVRSADLIVVGTRQHTGLRRALLGSVGRAVLTSTEASVLVVKTQPR